MNEIVLYLVVCVKAACIVGAKRDYNGTQALGSNTVRILNCYLHS